MSDGAGKAHDAPWPQQRPTVILVDAFSSGALLAREAAINHRLVHVRSRLDQPATFAASLPSDVFHDDLAYPGHIDPDRSSEVLRQLASYAPIAVIPASEFGVEVADEIAAQLGLPGNDVSRSASRRDKYLMMRALETAGVRTPRQHHGTDVRELLRWRKTERLDRVVVKPLDSAGSEDVYICVSAAEIAAAATAIIGKTNLMLRMNEAILMQEYLAGDEYIVNTVSHRGRHWFTDAWISGKTIRQDTRMIYDYEDLLASDDVRLAEILRYVSDVLDALGIREGPAHTELICTAEGPCLLETGARVSGLANPPALNRCTGANQISLTLDCYANDGRALTRRPKQYPRFEMARCVNLIAYREVPLPEHALRDALGRLAAVESIRFRLADGTLTRRTVDLNSSPGVVFLVHPDPAEIDKAYDTIRAVEHELI